MLAKEHRLKRSSDFDEVFKHGKSVFDPVCGVRFQKNNLPDSRFAVVVGTKVHKRAVKRNAVRRQYREILRLHMDQFAPGFDVILLTSKQALELDYAEKEAQLKRVLKKAGLFVRL